MTPKYIQSSGAADCEQCDFTRDWPDGDTWKAVREHVEDNPGHQVVYCFTVDLYEGPSPPAIDGWTIPALMPPNVSRQKQEDSWDAIT